MVRLTPDQAGAVAGVLSALARVREATELEARVTTLESRATAAQGSLDLPDPEPKL